MSLIDTLTKILNPKSLFKKKSNSVVAIDIGSSSIKVIQIRGDRGKAILETYGEIATGPYLGMSVGQAVTLNPDKIVEALTDVLREANITGRAGGIAIPLRSSLLMAIDLPLNAEKNLAETVPFEARKYIPVPITEVELDWWEIPQRENFSSVAESQQPADALGSRQKTLEVLIAAIHKDTIKLFQDVSTKLNFDLQYLEIETFSAIRSCLHNELAPVVIVDMGAGTTKVVIVDYGVVRMSHTIGKGSQDLTVAISKSMGISLEKAEEVKREVGLVERVLGSEISTTISPVIEYIFAEIEKSIIAYQKKNKRTVSRIILIGGGSQLKGVVETAQRMIAIPITIGTPFDTMETPAFLEPVLRAAGPSFSVAIGLALRKLEGL